MKERAKNDSDISFLMRNGIHIYPVYDKLRNRWYVEVMSPNNTIELKRYAKEIGSGKVLSGKVMQKPIEKTAKHWCNILTKINKK